MTQVISTIRVLVFIEKSHSRFGLSTKRGRVIFRNRLITARTTHLVTRSYVKVSSCHTILASRSLWVTTHAPEVGWLLITRKKHTALDSIIASVNICSIIRISACASSNLILHFFLLALFQILMLLICSEEDVFWF